MFLSDVGVIETDYHLKVYLFDTFETQVDKGDLEQILLGQVVLAVILVSDRHIGWPSLFLLVKAGLVGRLVSEGGEYVDLAVPPVLYVDGARLTLPLAWDSTVDGDFFHEFDRGQEVRDQLGLTTTVPDPLKAIDTLSDIYFRVLEDYGVVCLVDF